MTNPGSDLARLRRVTQKTCPICGRVFVARLVAIYCSAPCRMRAAYEDRKARKARHGRKA